MASVRYRELQRRIGELRKHFLPKRFDPTGTYKEMAHDRARAFRLLAHAEVEAFIEDRVVEVANSAYSCWAQTGKIGTSLLALLAYEEQGRTPPTSLLSPPQKSSPDLSGRIERAKNSFNYYVRTLNHGVKEDNVLRLLLPIGIAHSQIDPAWLLTLNSWGTSRGDLAHRAKRVCTPPDPQDELKIIRYLLKGLRDIDKSLQKL